VLLLKLRLLQLLADGTAVCACVAARVFGGDRIKNLMVAFRVEDLPMESQMLSDALDTAQKRVESYFYDIRKWAQCGSALVPSYCTVFCFCFRS
jgi:hypothetical protein